MATKIRVLVLFFIAFPLVMTAQSESDISLRVKYLPDVRIESGNSYIPSFEKPGTPVLTGYELDIAIELDSSEVNKEILQRMANIYKMHLLALEAQINYDVITAESYISDALMAIQNTLTDFPEVQENRKFTELYRTVMTEYQEFYGIDEPIVDIHGEIFAVHREMFNDDNWFYGEHIVLPENLTVRETQVPLIRNRQVNNHIAYLTMRRPEIMENWLKRSVRYFPMMTQIFEEEGVPVELIHLAMVESGLRSTARSHAHAVGMWQFIRATGSVYGLEVNWWVDERRDPEKATRAAAQHLRDLYEHWGDWHMAMANYNVSTRRMNSSVRQAGGVRNYWEIYPFLPRETRGYVPGFIAATLVAMNPEEFGFEKIYEGDPYAYEVVEIDGSVDLSLLAECAGITTQELQEYNPELLRWATPPGPEPYPLKIPIGRKEQFLAAFEQIPDEKRHNNMVIHTVKRGETLGLIANRFGTTVREMYQVNQNLSSLIHPGQELVIPVPEGSNVAIRSDRPSNAQVARTSRAVSQASSTANRPPNTVAVTYVVKSGDTVGHIAHWFGTQSWRVRSWNNIGNNIRPGQRLTLYVPSSQRNYYEGINNMTFAQKQSLRSGGAARNLTVNDSGTTSRYVVRRNDNLYDLARKNNTTVQELMRLNGLTSSRIYVGQTLIVPD